MRGDGATGSLFCIGRVGADCASGAFLTVLSLLASMLLVCPDQASSELAVFGQAENGVGTLMVKRADNRLERLTGKGTLPIYEGDECKTEAGSKAFIRFADGTQLAMNENTTFIVRTRMDRARAITQTLKLLSGEIWVKATPTKTYEVETPAGTAVLKGGEFDFQVRPDGKSILTSFDGVVEYDTPFGSCSISAFRQSHGERGKKCTEPNLIDNTEGIAWTITVRP